jgi:mannose-6-phosphate isomerase
MVFDYNNVHIYKLKNSIQHYPWGSINDIPELLGIPNPEQKPMAELWLGAHPKAPSLVLKDDDIQPLDDFIENNSPLVLGDDISNNYGTQLPFLFKVLASQNALALQVHPTVEQAQKGFERENVLGIALDSPQRNYLDRNHKPELICALRPFWVLAGFRDLESIRSELRKLHITTIEKEDSGVEDLQKQSALKQLFESILLMEQEKKQTVIDEVVNKVSGLNEDRYKWIMELNTQYPGDIGVISPLFLNLFKLQPGQALYLKEGMVHAYLDGVGMELMSNSDNVVRGGLTVRHIDIEEFLSLINYDLSSVEPLDPEEEKKGVDVYRTPALDFQLTRLRIDRHTPYIAPKKRSVEIAICLDGYATLYWGDVENSVDVKKGDSFLVPAKAPAYSIRGEGVFFKAHVPSNIDIV